MKYTEIKESAPSGTKKFVGGITYQKQINGKWLIEPNSAVRNWLSSLYVGRGLTMHQVTKETGIPHSSLQKLLNHFDLMRGKKDKSKTHLEIVRKEAKTIRKWNFEFVPSGKVAARLSEKYATDMCDWAFLAACKRAGAPFHGRRTLRNLFLEKNIENIQRMYVEHSASEIVRRINAKHPLMKMTCSRVLDFMRTNSIPVRHMQEVAERNAAKHFHLGRTSAAMLGRITNRQSWHHKLTLDANDLTYRQYKDLVHTATNAARIRFKSEYEHLKRKPDYSIDHRFSVHDGYFKLNPDTMLYERRGKVVPLKLMVHPLNLQMLPTRTNRIKGSNSWITLRQLIDSVKQSEFKIRRETEHG